MLMAKKHLGAEFGKLNIEKSICPNNLLHTLNKNGERYIGEHEGGIPNGEGRQTWPGGYTYVGSFKGGLRHGWGTYTHPSGKRQIGYFFKGKYRKNWKPNK